MSLGQEKGPAVIAGVIQDNAGVLLSMVNVQMEGTCDGDALASIHPHLVHPMKMCLLGLLTIDMLNHEHEELLAEIMVVPSFRKGISNTSLHFPPFWVLNAQTRYTDPVPIKSRNCK